MGVRLFDWRDLPALQRYRNSMVFLDNALVLTRGSQMLSGVLFSYLAPSMGVCTCVNTENGNGAPLVLGQFIQKAGSPFSHLTFLAPGEALEEMTVGPLVDFMLTIAGERGAFRLLADVDEQAEAFEALRRCGFVIYNRQHIWKMVASSYRVRVNDPAEIGWQTAVDRDAIPVKVLYNNLVPGLVQQYEPYLPRKPRGWVLYVDGELEGYVDMIVGRCGIWMQPFIHPDTANVEGMLASLVGKISERYTKPVYLCVRSAQAWLEPAIEALGAEAGPRQAVMVRQLVVPQKAVRLFATPTLEGSHPEVTAPFAQLENH